MKICLVTAFPPSRGGLSEYGFHIARELQQNSFLSVTVLADELGEPAADHDIEGLSVVRCWSFNDARNAKRILSCIRELNPDVVWFNLLFTTFGHSPLSAFFGLATPLLTRLNGFYTHVTLHHLMDTVDLKDAGVRFPRLYKAAGALATHMLLMSNSITVLMPNYRKILIDQYGRGIVQVRAHGIFSRPEYPDFSLRGNPEQRILAFGKWGTYKRLEAIIEAFQMVAQSLPNARLIVAGGNHPRTPGYVESVAHEQRNDPRIQFTGYVKEEDIAALFRSASIVVMPYSSSTGSSGVAHVASAFGVPIVCADIPDFHQMAEEEGLAIDFYQLGNQEDLAGRLVSLLQSAAQQEEMGKQNFSAALRMTMPSIVHDYLRHFDIAQRTRVLKQHRWLRRLPRWLPSKSLLGRAVSRRRPGWIERPSLSYRPTDGYPEELNSIEKPPALARQTGASGAPHLPVEDAEPLAEELDCTILRKDPKPAED
jgi:glycosyltransferase involved in cell wall biosynthesis